jgi:Fanconi anemia group M protein
MRRAWLYPDSSTLREYQFKAAWRLISNNSLVCFPTGTGKTLIAAVVMFNFYRWFPKVRECVGRRVGRRVGE